jgi:hypothetical protein
MKKILALGVVAVILVVIAYVAWGKVQEALLARAVMHKLTEAGLTPEALKKLGEAGYQADPQILARIATGGQPLGRWKEGLMFEGIAPMPWLKSAANWFPGTEELQPGEIRVTFSVGERRLLRRSLPFSLLTLTSPAFPASWSSGPPPTRRSSSGASSSRESFPTRRPSPSPPSSTGPRTRSGRS